MITSLPRIKDPKGNNRDRRKGIPQVGKVFPKNPVQEEVDEKLDLLCVGLEKDKDVSLPSVELDLVEDLPFTPVEAFDGSEGFLPGLPSIHGGRRGVLTPSPEPVDFLIKGEAQKKALTQTPLETITELPEGVAVKEMRSNLEPLIDSLFEEDKLFAQEFEEDGLSRVLFIRKMGIYVEIRITDYVPGVVCTPLFHCPRCKDQWTSFGKVPENCPYPRQLTHGPAIHMKSKRKPRFQCRKQKSKRRLGDIKEDFIVSGSGTVLNEDNTIASDDVTVENLNLREIDAEMIRAAFQDMTDAESSDDFETAKSIAEALGFSEEQYNEFARIDKVDGSTGEKSGLLGLDSLTMNDLPDDVKEKLLSILRTQRKKNQDRSAGKKVEGWVETGDRISGKGSFSESGNESTMKTTTRRNSQENRSQRNRGSQDSSAGGRKMSNMANNLMDSDDENDEAGLSPSGSASDVLAYKELQNQRRARKKNAAVKNRSGQPDTPHQRLGRHSMSGPCNSTISGYEDGDSDEEIWKQARASRIGSSRAQISESRTSMLRKYSRAMGSGNVSISSLDHDDQMSYSSLYNTESHTDMPSDSNGGAISNRRRRQNAKKEKNDMNKRPGGYHSKVINDMALGQGSPSKSHATVSIGKISMMHAPDEKASLARFSVTDARHSLSRASSVTMKRSMQSHTFLTGGNANAKEAPNQKTLPSPETQCETSMDVDNNQTAEIQIQLDEAPALDAAVPQASSKTTIEQAQGKQLQSSEDKLEKLGIKRASQAKSKLLFSVDDLKMIHRLPVSSAFTYSFYELPSQHREQNESIKQAASRIGQRKKTGTPDHFRSRSAP